MSEGWHNLSQHDNALALIAATSSPPFTAVVWHVDRVQNRLALIDGQRLAAEMVRRNVGVQVREVHEVKRIDEDFFTE